MNDYCVLNFFLRIFFLAENRHTHSTFLKYQRCLASNIFNHNAIHEILRPFFYSYSDPLCLLHGLWHGLRTPREEIAFTARLKIQSQSQIFMYGRSKCLPRWPKFSDIFDFCHSCVSVVRSPWSLASFLTKSSQKSSK